MRKKFCASLLFFFSIVTTTILLFSCAKEFSCEGCRELNRPPIANAGPDRVTTLPTDSVSLNGTGSSDPDGTIVEWLWTKISGPSSAAINNPSLSATVITDLVGGSYQFELKITDDGGLFAMDTVIVIVNATSSPNHPPVADAGVDQEITLPADATTLDGSGSADPDNDIAGYQWTKISGPVSFIISNAGGTQTIVTNLVEGLYQFELKVTDAGGGFSKDTVQVTVKAAPPQIVDCVPNRPLTNALLVPVGTLSQARSEIAVAAAGGKILFAGGGGSTRVDIFDVASNSWSIAELSSVRAWIAAVASGNKIFFAGGQYLSGNSSNEVDIYDVATNAWTMSDLNRGLDGADGLAAANAGNKVLFAGGNWGVNPTDRVDIHDLSTSFWTAASLSVPRNFITGVSTGSKAFFSGGDPWSAQMSDVIDIYDNSSGVWATTNLLVRRAYHAAIAVNNILYFAGGLTDNRQPTCSVETLNVNTGERTMMSLFSPAIWDIDNGQNAMLKDNKIIFLRHDGGANAQKFDIYDIQKGNWFIGVLPQPIPKGSCAISINNTVYIAGGIVNGVASNQVWRLEF
jgi:N-acetylneuraminic acid mutarotase